MAQRDILIHPHPSLREVAEPISSFDKELHRLIDDMKETMYAAPGIGLAATQIGVPVRVAVIDCSDDRSEFFELVNPTITRREGGKIRSEEGCLSIPDYRDTIMRDAEVFVQAFNRHGEPLELHGKDLLARCIQHEIDHLDGILFVDRLSQLKKQLFKHWLKKQELEE